MNHRQRIGWIFDTVADEGNFFIHLSCRWNRAGR
jgi:hypothetical protein